LSSSHGRSPRHFPRSTAQKAIQFYRMRARSLRRKTIS
jgi:hypothetical protein